MATQQLLTKNVKHTSTLNATASACEDKNRVDDLHCMIPDKGAPMGYRIIRNEDKTTYHKSNILNNGSNRIGISGSSGTGKSTIVLELLPMFSDDTTDILLCTSKPYDNSHSSISNYCDANKIKFHKLNEPETIADTIQKIVDTKKETDHFICIFDDISTTNTTSMSDPINDLITTSYRVLRSFGGSLIMITQSYSAIPTRVRENLTHRFIFSLGNVYSVRAFLDDTCGLFFTGDNEKAVRNDIKNIYKRVYTEPHGWILVKSTPPMISWKWSEQLYPINKDKQQDIEQFKSTRGRGLLTKTELYHKAVELGFPVYMFRNASIQVLTEYIEKVSKLGDLTPVNRAPEIAKLLKDVSERGGLSGKSLLDRITNMIRQFQKNHNPLYLAKLEALIDESLEKGNITEERVKYLLDQHQMSRYFS